MPEDREFQSGVKTTADTHLKQANRGVEYIASVQGGLEYRIEDTNFLSLELNRRITNLTGISQITGELRGYIFEQSAQGDLTDSSISSMPHSIENQHLFAQTLLGEHPTLLAKFAEVEAKIHIFEDFLQNHGELAAKLGIWKGTISEAVRDLCPDTESLDGYQRMVNTSQQRLSNPEEVTHRRTDGTVTTTVKESYRDRLSKLLLKEGSEEVISRFVAEKKGGVLAESLIDEYLETAFVLNTIRVLDRIQKPLDYSGKFNKLTSCLNKWEEDPQYTQIIEANNLRSDFDEYTEEVERIKASNLTSEQKDEKVEELDKNFKEKCRPLVESAFDENNTEEAVNIVGTRNSILELQQQAQAIKSSDIPELEKNQQLEELDMKLQDLLIPIANKVARIFPHQSSTNLTTVLENEEAVCAGKVNILLAVSKYLGLKSRASMVLEIMDNSTEGHVYFECDLLSSKKLVFDANFLNRKRDVSGKTDEEIIQIIRDRNPHIKEEEIPGTLKFYKLAEANAQIIPEESRIFMYTLENTGNQVEDSDQLQSTKDTQHLVIRINPYNGHKEIWRANIPYPHLVTAPDQDGYTYINSSFTQNAANFVNAANRDIGMYLLKKQIEICPFDVTAHIRYVGMLEPADAINYLQQLKKDKPYVFWDGVYTKLAERYFQEDRINEAEAIYTELKGKDQNLYVKSVGRLSRLYFNATLSVLDVDATRRDYLRSRAKALLDDARSANSEVFYSGIDNITTLADLYKDKDDLSREIAFLEEVDHINPTLFWAGTNDYDSNNLHGRIRRLYDEQISKDPSIKDKVIAFYQTARSSNSEYYAENVHRLAGIYAEYESDQQKALAALEEVRKTHPSYFFNESENIDAIAKLLRREGNTNQLIAVYQDCKQFNPHIFWEKPYNTQYTKLMDLYATSGNEDLAISLAEEAQSNDPSFWSKSHEYGSGYTKLVELYRKTGRLEDALKTCEEAKEKNPDFFSSINREAGSQQMVSVYEGLGRIEEAIKLLLETQDKDKYFWESQYGTPTSFRLADLYVKNGQAEEAIKVYEELKERNPVNYWKRDYYKVCQLYAQTGQTEKANQLQEELISKLESYRDGEYDSFLRDGLEPLANLYIQNAQDDRAITMMEKIKEEYSYFPLRLRLVLADLYVKHGNLEGARTAYQEAVDAAQRFGFPENIPYITEKAQSQGITL